MCTSLDDVEFLAASENRVLVLTYLQQGPADRQEIHEETGVSRSTLSRCLTELQERGWITQSGSECEITTLGRAFVDEFVGLVEMAGAVRKLRALDALVSLDEMGIEPRRFRNADVAVATRNGPTAAMQRAKTLIRQADRVSLLAGRFESALAGVLWDRTVHGTLTGTVVGSDEVVDTVCENAELARMLHETLETGQLSLYRSDESVAHVLFLVDDTRGCLLAYDDDGVVRAELDTDDEGFRSWVESTIDGHRERAQAVSPDELTA